MKGRWTSLPRWFLRPPRPLKRKRRPAATRTARILKRRSIVKHTKHAVESRTYSLAETAAILGFGRSTLQDHVRNGSAGHLHPVKLGRTTRFPKATIDALAEGAA